MPAESTVQPVLDENMEILTIAGTFYPITGLLLLTIASLLQ
jgi:hypothetical protein